MEKFWRIGATIKLRESKLSTVNMNAYITYAGINCLLI